MLMNPGPAIDRDAKRPRRSSSRSADTISSATARGFLPRRPASCIAALVEKSPCDSCRGISRETETSASSPHSATFFRTAEKTRDSTIRRASKQRLEGKMIVKAAV